MNLELHCACKVTYKALPVYAYLSAGLPVTTPESLICHSSNAINPEARGGITGGFCTGKGASPLGYISQWWGMAFSAAPHCTMTLAGAWSRTPWRTAFLWRAGDERGIWLKMVPLVLSSLWGREGAAVCADVNAIISWPLSGLSTWYHRLAKKKIPYFHIQCINQLNIITISIYLYIYLIMCVIIYCIF